MKASVVIPVFNKAPFLQECLDSVFAQSFGRFEVIAVDDASTDGSLEILRRCPDPRLRVIALGFNVGPAGCAQRGMEAATGEYIIRVDADDIMHPERIAHQVAFMDAHPELGASGTWMELIGQPGVLRRTRLTDAECRAGSLFHIPIFQPTSIYRRAVLDASGLRYADEWPRYGEDWLFQLRLLRVARVANLPEALVQYRLGPQNSSATGDTHAGLRRIYHEVLRWYALPHGEAELRCHLRAAGVHESTMTPTDVAQVRAYLRALGERASAAGQFDASALRSACDRAWDALAYQLPRFGWATTLAYLLRDARPSFAKWRYLASSLIMGRVYAPYTERNRNKPVS